MATREMQEIDFFPYLYTILGYVTATPSQKSLCLSAAAGSSQRFPISSRLME